MPDRKQRRARQIKVMACGVGAAPAHEEQQLRDLSQMREGDQKDSGRAEELQ